MCRHVFLFVSMFIIAGCASSAAPIARVPGFDGEARRSFVQLTGTVPAELRQFRIRIVASGAERDILIIRNPETGVWWWAPLRVEEHAPRGAAVNQFPGELARMVIAPDAIGFFMISPPLGVYVRSSNSRAASMDEAERTLMANLVRDARPAADVDHAFRDISLNQVGTDFVQRPGSAFIPPATVVSVGREKGLWMLKLAGPYGDFADVTLDDDFHVTNVRRYR